MIDTTHYASIPSLRTGNRIPGAYGFSVPKSPLRIDASDDGKRIAGNKNITDSVELSGARPDLLGLPQQTPPPLNAEDRVPFGLGKEADYLDGEKRRAAGQGEQGALEETEESEKEGGEEAKAGEATDGKGKPLDEEQQREIDELKNRDREVRQHEQAHKAVGGSHAGAVSYDYQQGPDGKRYAVGGEVSIDVSEEKDPSATASKMRQVRAAALAPAEPSGQDLQVAAEASRIENEARQEMSQERTAKMRGGESGQDAGASDAGKADGEKGEESRASDAATPNRSAQPPSSGVSGGASSPYAKLSDPYSRFAAFAGPALSFGQSALDVIA